MSKSLKHSKQGEHDAEVRKNSGKHIVFLKNQGGVKASAGSEMSLVSGKYHENKALLSWRWRLLTRC